MGASPLSRDSALCAPQREPQGRRGRLVDGGRVEPTVRRRRGLERRPCRPCRRARRRAPAPDRARRACRSRPRPPTGGGTRRRVSTVIAAIGIPGISLLPVTTDQHVARAAARRAAVAARRADGTRRSERIVSTARSREYPELPHVREAAAEPPGAARVGDEPVRGHLERQVRLDQLDRLVREVRERVGDSLQAVLARPCAPGADDHLGHHERPAVLVAAERDQRRPALAGRDHPVRRHLRERTHDRVVDPVADRRRARRRRRAAPG